MRGERGAEGGDGGADFEFEMRSSRGRRQGGFPLRVDGVFGLRDGAETFLPCDRVDAVEPRFATADAEGSDGGGDVVDYLSLGAGWMAEMAGALPGSAETVAAGRAR